MTLLSGGLDSTTVTTQARDQVKHLTALTFHYGQTHNKEVKCAEKVARLLNIQHKLVDISAFGEVAWYSSLTSPERFPMPKDRLAAVPLSSADILPSESATSIPITYVPLRNTFFITIAGAFLESQALYAIEAMQVAPRDVEAYIYLAPNAIDYSGYPDCRPEYYEKMRDTLLYGSKLWAEYHVPIRIETPIIHLSKAEIVRLGMDLKAPLEHTWSCYEAGELPCGRCDSCILRARGFAEAGHDDPLLVRLGRASP